MARFLIALMCVSLLSGAARADYRHHGAELAQSTQPWVGKWLWLSEFGPIKLAITAVRADGRVDGRMDFPRYGTHRVFEDKASAASATAKIVNGELQIRFTRNGYNLRLVGGMLKGHYFLARTGRKTAATFTK